MKKHYRSFALNLFTHSLIILFSLSAHAAIDSFTACPAGSTFKDRGRVFVNNSANCPAGSTPSSRPENPSCFKSAVGGCVIPKDASDDDLGTYVGMCAVN